MSDTEHAELIQELRAALQRQDERQKRQETLFRRVMVAFVVTAGFGLFQTITTHQAEAGIFSQVRKDMELVDKILTRVDVILTEMDTPSPALKNRSPIQVMGEIVYEMDYALDVMQTDQTLAKVNGMLDSLSELRGIQDVLEAMPRMANDMGYVRADMDKITGDMTMMSNNMAVMTRNTGIMSYDMHGMSSTVTPTMGRMNNFMRWMP